ncbi:MAG: CBS domain-containing protein [Candidatus Altiarchaeales archaeon]|nr:CBS domain-containing protein [Candidatus Altiarchaeales archaeon]MBD3415964.1 CBS domain-containing protein [Candidatus Altiarchaeales archaeon]
MMQLPPLAEIEKLRKRLGLTQTELAVKAEVSQSLIARLEAGTVDPRYSKVAKIFLALDEMKGKELEAQQIMTKGVVGIQHTASIEYAATKLKKHNLSQMPVFDGDKAIGSFSEKVVLGLISKGADAKTFSKEEVGEHMEESFPTVKPETPLSVVSALLEHNTAVVVQEQGKNIGIITKADLLKVVHK